MPISETMVPWPGWDVAELYHLVSSQDDNDKFKPFTAFHETASNKTIDFISAPLSKRGKTLFRILLRWNGQTDYIKIEAFFLNIISNI